MLTWVVRLDGYRERAEVLGDDNQRGHAERVAHRYARAQAKGLRDVYGNGQGDPDGKQPGGEFPQVVPHQLPSQCRQGEMQVAHADVTALQHAETGADQKLVHFFHLDGAMAMKVRHPPQAPACRRLEVRYENASAGLEHSRYLACTCAPKWPRQMMEHQGAEHDVEAAFLKR